MAGSFGGCSEGSTNVLHKTLGRQKHSLMGERKESRSRLSDRGPREVRVSAECKKATACLLVCEEKKI